MQIKQRKMTQLPVLLQVGFLLFFCIQITFHQLNYKISDAHYRHLNEPLEVELYRAISFGSDKLLSYLLLIRLQLHDNQKGQHVNYRHLDYALLSDWLMTLYDLNPDSDYPGFLASRVYSNVQDKSKIRQMIHVVEMLFDKNPERHWRRMTEVCLLMKHKLNDLDSALTIAEKIAKLPSTIKIPYWARDMKLVLLDELNQYESAQLLISSMLQSGSVTDHDELRFLRDRLLKIQQSLSENKQLQH